MTSLSGVSTRSAWMVGVLLSCVAGCEVPGKPVPGARAEVARRSTEFPALFAKHCAGCHGAEGRLGPAPPLNDPLFLAIASDEVLEDAIVNGRPGTPMPSLGRKGLGPLTESEVQTLVKGIRETWGGNVTGDPPAYASTSTGDATRGAKLFEQACADCHGEQGRGESGAEDAVDGLNNRAFLELASDRFLRRIVITGRPDLGMPNYAEDDGRAIDFEPLTSEDVDDLVALLASWRVGSKATSVVAASQDGER